MLCVEILYPEANMYLTLRSYTLTEVAETNDRRAEWLRQRHLSPYHKTLNHQNDHEAVILRLKKLHNVTLTGELVAVVVIRCETKPLCCATFPRNFT